MAELRVYPSGLFFRICFLSIPGAGKVSRHTGFEEAGGGDGGRAVIIAAEGSWEWK